MIQLGLDGQRIDSVPLLRCFLNKYQSDEKALIRVLCESIRKPVKFKLLCVFLQPARQRRIHHAQSDFSGIWF